MGGRMFGMVKENLCRRCNVDIPGSQKYCRECEKQILKEEEKKVHTIKF